MVVEIPVEAKIPIKFTIILLVSSQEQSPYLGQSTKKEQSWFWLVCRVQKLIGNYQPCFPNMPLLHQGMGYCFEFNGTRVSMARVVTQGCMAQLVASQARGQPEEYSTHHLVGDLASKE